MSGYPWPGGARAGLCFTADFDGESPYLWRSRTDPTPDVGELEQRRYGPRRGIANVLAMLAETGVKATIFTPGWIASRNPEAVAAAHAAGHEPALHGWLHEPPTQITTDELRTTLERSSAAIEKITGVRPVGYRSPSWQMTADTFGVLRELGLLYDSSLMGDDVPYRIGETVEVPVAWSTDDAPYLRYVGGEPRPPTPARTVIDAWRDELAAAKRTGTLCMITIHPWMSGRPARIGLLGELLGEAAADQDLWVGTVGELAEHHARVTKETLTVPIEELGRPGD